MLRNKQRSLMLLETKVLWRQNRIAEGLSNRQLERFMEYKGIWMIFLEESCIIVAPKWQAIFALVLEDCFSCKATIDDFSAYSTGYQQNRVF